MLVSITKIIVHLFLSEIMKKKFHKIKIFLKHLLHLIKIEQLAKVQVWGLLLVKEL